MVELPEVSIRTRRWLESKLTAEEIISWGADTIRALGVFIDSLDKED